MTQLDQMQELLEAKIIQISSLKQALQLELNLLAEKPKNINLFKENLKSLISIIPNFKSILTSAKNILKGQFLSSAIEGACINSIRQLLENNNGLQEANIKVKFQLQQQIKLNQLMKEEVLDLKQMITLHIEKSRKQIDQRDSIIETLKQSLEDERVSKQNHEKDQASKCEHLETINQEEELNFTSRVFNGQQTNFKISKNLQMPRLSEDSEANILSALQKAQQSSKRTLESKTRVRFFIQDFRNVVENTNQNSIQSFPASFTREKIYQSQAISSNDLDNQVVSMFDFGRFNRHTESYQDKQNRDQTERISIDLQRSNSRELRSKSKQKIKLTYINKTPQLKTKDLNILHSSNSKERSSCFDKERDSQKRLRVVSIEKKKLYGQSRNTPRWMTETLQKVDLYVGDKRTQQHYKGQTRGRIRDGVGRLEYINGLVYEGQFKDHVRHGKGVLTLNDKLIYQGEWQRDKMCGKGVIQNIYLINKRKIPESSFLRNNSYYCGEFKDNSMCGNGSWVINSCQKFQSVFKNNLPQGEFRYKKYYWCYLVNMERLRLEHAGAF